MPPPDRRKVTVAPAVDRRKSYVDVMERVLGHSHVPDSAPPESGIVSFVFSHWERVITRPAGLLPDSSRKK